VVEPVLVKVIVTGWLAVQLPEQVRAALGALGVLPPTVGSVSELAVSKTKVAPKVPDPPAVVIDQLLRVSVAGKSS
jgi:hypothetical protein